VVKTARSSKGLRGGRRPGVRKLAHFEQKNWTLFNMDNTIFSLISGGLMKERGTQTAAGGAKH